MAKSCAFVGHVRVSNPKQIRVLHMYMHVLYMVLTIIFKAHKGDGQAIRHYMARGGSLAVDVFLYLAGW